MAADTWSFKGLNQDVLPEVLRPLSLTAKEWTQATTEKQIATCTATSLTIKTNE